MPVTQFKVARSRKKKAMPTLGNEELDDKSLLLDYLSMFCLGFDLIKTGLLCSLPYINRFTGEAYQGLVPVVFVL